MIRFQIKKAFFDGWDNFLGLFLCNIVFSAFPFGMILFFSKFGISSWKSVPVFLLFLFSAVLCFTGISGLTFTWSRYKKEGISVFFMTIKSRIFHALLYWLISVLLLFTSVFIIPMYLNTHSPTGFFLALILFWTVFAVLLALQYFFPLAMNFQSDGAFRTLKKCFIVMADNLGISVFLFVRTLFDLTVSFFLALFIPGAAGISLSQMCTFRFILLRYDYLELHPGLDKKDAKWDIILYDEMQAVGPRSLKNMFIPWK